jgi:hypothetical protein
MCIIIIKVDTLIDGDHHMIICHEIHRTSGVEMTTTQLARVDDMPGTEIMTTATMAEGEKAIEYIDEKTEDLDTQGATPDEPVLAVCVATARLRRG